LLVIWWRFVGGWTTPWMGWLPNRWNAPAVEHLWASFSNRDVVRSRWFWAPVSSPSFFRSEMAFTALWPSLSHHYLYGGRLSNNTIAVIYI
jgi:hypothetical protein